MKGLQHSMDDQQEKTPMAIIEQKIVLFMDDELIAVRATDGEVYVSVRHLSDALALDPQGQTQRIERNSVLLSGYRRGEITTPGGPQQTYLLRVDLVPFWLAGVSTQRIKDVDRRHRVEQYQQNVAKVLWEAFQEGRLTDDTTFDDLLRTDSETVQAYKMLQALVKLARNQIILEAQLETHTSQLANHEKRLEQVETTLGDPGRHVNSDQASQISQGVKAVAHAMGGHGKHYQAVYGELYRKFGLTSYKLLPARRFQEAMDWLTNWYGQLTGSKDIPF
jgi:ferritin-like metal-binding protein YciE